MTTSEKTTMTFGRRVYGVGVMAMGVVCLVWGDFIQGQPVPKGFPARTALAYAVGAFLVVAGAAVAWRRTAAWGAAALTAYYTVIVVLLMDGHLLLKHYAEYGMYSGAAEQVGIAAAGLIVYAASYKRGYVPGFVANDAAGADLGDGMARRLTRLGQMAFGVCAVLFGGAHFVYMNLTAPLVPKWLPPTQVFWGYATGICFVAAGVAMVTGVKARLTAVLLTAMLGSFTVLVHVPMLRVDPSHFN
jgi:uncharacterized membrane protein YphA (DoxX/SURF4 family)